MAVESGTFQERGKLSLVLGVDGSGKSTFLDGLNARYGSKKLEATSTPRAKAFKIANIDAPVNSAFIDQREDIFLDLNRQFDQLVHSELEDGNDVATTSSSIVTMVSHSLMRAIIGERKSSDVNDVADRWVEDGDTLHPDRLVLVHAPCEVIRQRIAERQDAGDRAERFWGFNSLYFISRYQETWLDVMQKLNNETAVPCVTLDSSELRPEEMVDAFGLRVPAQ